MVNFFIYVGVINQPQVKYARSINLSHTCKRNEINSYYACRSFIQVYLVAAYLLACSYLTQNALHSTSYIISILLLYTYNKDITH